MTVLMHRYIEEAKNNNNKKPTLPGSIHFFSLLFSREHKTLDIFNPPSRVYNRILTNQYRQVRNVRYRYEWVHYLAHTPFRSCTTNILRQGTQLSYDNIFFIVSMFSN